YALAGWGISERIPGDARPIVFTTIRMDKSSFQQGELLYGLLREDGQWLPATTPPTPTNGAAQATGLRRWLALAQRDATGRPTYQVQVFAQSYSSLSPSQQGAIEDLFREAAQTLAQQTLSQLRSDR